MKKLKKGLLLSLGLVTIAAAPIAAVVSCGKPSTTIATHKTDDEKSKEYVDKLNAQQIQGANKIIDEIQKLALQPTTSISVDAANLQPSDLTFPSIPAEFQKSGVFLEVVKGSISVDANLETTANLKVAVKSTLTGTKVATYDAKVKGLLTASQYKADEAQRQRDNAKINAQKLIDDAVAKAQTPQLTNKDSLNLTGSLVKPEMFVPNIIDSQSGTNARVTKIEQSATTIDGTVVIATVSVSSTVAGTVAKEFKVPVSGFKSNEEYEKSQGVKLTLQSYPQMHLSDLPQDGIIWERGITYYAYAQTISYLRNFVEKLGWSSPDHDVVVPEVSATGPIIVEGYNVGKSSPATLEQSLITARETSSSYKLSGLSRYQSVADKSGYKLAGGAWTNFKHIEVATDAVIRGAALYKQSDLPTNFNTMQPLDKYKALLALLAKAYPGGPKMQGADTILFSIDETNKKANFWIAGSVAAAQKNHDDLLKLKTTFESPHVKDGVDSSTPKPLSATKDLLLDPGGVDHTPNGNAVGILRDFNWDEAYGAYEGNGNFGKIKFEKFGSWIDGDHPGQLKLRLWTGNGERYHESQALGTFTHTFESQPNAYPIFPILSGTEKDRNMLMIWNMIQNMKQHFDINGSLGLASGYINPDFSSFLNYLVKTPFDSTKFFSAFNQLNNGSHYFPAIEVFARGISGLDGDIRPTDGGASMMLSSGDKISQTGAAVGMATTLNGKQIINYIYKEDSIHYDSLTRTNLK